MNSKDRQIRILIDDCNRLKDRVAELDRCRVHALSALQDASKDLQLRVTVAQTVLSAFTPDKSGEGESHG